MLYISKHSPTHSLTHPLSLSTAVALPCLWVYWWRNMLRQPYVILGFFQTHLRGGCASVVLCLRIHPAAYKQVVLELNAASIGSFAFVVMKTPIITRALQEAMQEKLGRQRLVGLWHGSDLKAVKSCYVCKLLGICNLHYLCLKSLTCASLHISGI